MVNEKLLQMIFQTKALKVSPANKPFWYTSGTIGPYYINTHYLYGGEERATELLEFIDKNKENKKFFSKELTKLLLNNYKNDVIFKELIDQMVRLIKKNINIDEVDYISGGERRDWFFSYIIALMLGKPHLTIYKDLNVYEFSKEQVNEKIDLTNKKVLHIADLVTEASSYERAWIPAIKNKNGKIKWSVVVVDRKQGGRELLENKGLDFYPLIEIDKFFFKKALNMGLINEKQSSIIEDFLEEPYISMRNFLIEHPEFLKDALDSKEKDRERAIFSLDKDIYNIKKELQY